MKLATLIGFVLFILIHNNSFCSDSIEIMASTIDQNLKAKWPTDPHIATIRNRTTVKILTDNKISIGETSKEQAQEIYQNVLQQPQARNKNKLIYNETNQAGYSFSQAMAVHLEAIKKGVNLNHIFKIWAFNSPSQKSIQSHWRYHLATMILCNNGKYLVIDPMMTAPLEPLDWKNKLLAHTLDKKMLILVTSSSESIPTGPSDSSLKALNAESYKNYFLNLLKTLSAALTP